MTNLERICIMYMTLKDIAAVADGVRLSYNDDELRPALCKLRDLARDAVAKVNE